MKRLRSAVQLPSGANIVNDLSDIVEVLPQCEETFCRGESKPFRRHRRLVRSCWTSITWFKPSGRGAQLSLSFCAMAFSFRRAHCDSRWPWNIEREWNEYGHGIALGRQQRATREIVPGCSTTSRLTTTLRNELCVQSLSAGRTTGCEWKSIPGRFESIDPVDVKPGGRPGE
jgi:hypothetical protein